MCCCWMCLLLPDHAPDLAAPQHLLGELAREGAWGTSQVFKNRNRHLMLFLPSLIKFIGFVWVKGCVSGMKKVLAGKLESKGYVHTLEAVRTSVTLLSGSFSCKSLLPTFVRFH